MPKIRRGEVPETVFRHLARRMRERRISVEQLGSLAEWINTEPIVPIGKWHKRFAQFTVCGEGELVKTFLLPGQLPDGEEVA